MKQTDATGVITGSFSPKDILLSGLYAHDITSSLRGGIQAKLLYSSYESYTALAMFFDLGINYYHVEKELSLSLVVKNLGGQLKKYDTENIAMPWDFQKHCIMCRSGSRLRLNILPVGICRLRR